MVNLHARLKHHRNCSQRVKKPRHARGFRALKLKHCQGKGWVSVEGSSAPFVDVIQLCLSSLLDNQYTVWLFLATYLRKHINLLYYKVPTSISKANTTVQAACGQGVVAF